MSIRDPELRKLAEDRVGKTLRNKWHLDRLLDIGGMAAVYVATHRNGNQVAVKILHPIFPEKSNVRERFLREGYLANKVKHPGAVTVLDDDIAEDGSMFLVMELLSGQSVESLLQQSGGTLSIQHVLAIADQTLDVLAAAHANGVIHRDIKPGNLFLTDSGQVKVLDFGLARLKVSDPKTALTGVGVIMGTSSYMPPEQARSKWDMLDGRTDLYAVGAVMFRMLSGHVVHEAATPTDRLLAAMSKPARSLATVMPDAPRALVDVVDKALAFDMDDRWENAKQMQLAVRQAFALIQMEEEQKRTSRVSVPQSLSSSPAQQQATAQQQPAPPPAPMVPKGDEATVAASQSSGGSIDVPLDFSESTGQGPTTVKSPHEVSILDVDDVMSVISEEYVEKLPEVSAVLVEELLTESDIASVFEAQDKDKKGS